MTSSQPSMKAPLSEFSGLGDQFVLDLPIEGVDLCQAVGVRLAGLEEA